ncbi:leucine efflux protein LeuE [Neisseria wadsworthii]|uniref:Leucine efflux protein n=1 Tax=Neisseria wadsworthii 9715 TaxID=1030841 RepID=G4CNJ8_9NEIS|nr:leucine efflux protein LeuE [Neisseria wadsworthii]EGZ49594.1 leucine efflux protein [Neisseria wadsworthii 9715]QMT36616.1 leucine efflux protein LeuE [Neisseria wadsworthii]
MLGTINLTTYIIGTIAVILLPGPNSMFCLSMAAQHGVKAAYRAIAGIILGDSLLILATVLGAGTLLKLYPPLFHGLKLVGGLYLAYIGFNLLRGAVRKWQLAPSKFPTGSEAAAEPAPHIFKRALLLSLTNPKAILFFLSFFVQFVDPAYPHPALSFLVLALILQATSFIYLNMLVFAGHNMTRLFRRHHKLSAAAMGAVGLMFAAFAVRMWVAAI